MEEGARRTGMLARIAKSRAAVGSLHSKEVVLRPKKSETTLKAAPQRRGHTSILLTDREPSPEGLLAELLGTKSARSAAGVSAQQSTGVTAPWWLFAAPRQSPQLDRLIPAARLLLQELSVGDIRDRDVTSAVKRAVSLAVQRLSDEVRVTGRDIQAATQELVGLIVGKGPLQPLYDDPLVTDIYVDSYDKIRCLRLGQAIETPFTFRSQQEYEAFFTAMLQSAGRVLSVCSPVVDCVLKDEWSSRVNAVHGSLREGAQSSLVIRVPRLRFATLYDLLRSQTLPASLAAWLSEYVSFGEGNILVMGPTGSGKTTLTTALLSAVGSDERVCTIEEIPEIFVSNCQVEKLVSRPPDSLGSGEIGVDTLLRAALHRAPHRIIIGEIRDREGALFLEALETGHAGSIATMHADNPVEGLWRLLDVIAAREALPLEVIQRRISRSVHLVIVIRRIEGRPCIADVSEVVPTSDGTFKVSQLVRYEGESKGKRKWRMVDRGVRILDEMEARGVELLSGPTLLPPVVQSKEPALGETLDDTDTGVPPE